MTNAAVWSIDTVLLPLIPKARTLGDLLRAQASQATTFIAATQAAGLFAQVTGTTFRGTVFIPTEAAFAQLLSDMGMTAAQLLSNRNLLLQILQMHVSPAMLPTARSVGAASTINTLASGKRLSGSTGWVADAGGRLGPLPALAAAALRAAQHGSRPCAAAPGLPSPAPALLPSPAAATARSPSPARPTAPWWSGPPSAPWSAPPPR
jgi:hypothetical protein